MESTDFGENGEEATAWGAIERLSTFDQARKGVIISEDGETCREVEIGRLDYRDKKDWLDRVLRVPEVDHEKLLLNFRNRIERVGLDIPTVEVRFENLNVETEVYVGTRGLPTIFNFYSNAVEGLLNYFNLLPGNKRLLSILDNVSGIIKPGRMTLLLGPPSSGKTTLLSTLAGKQDPKLKVSGRVTYNGHGLHEFIPQRTSAYISQYDVHDAEMTVRETLAFSARCQGVGNGYDMLMELLRREKEQNIKPDPNTDIFLKGKWLEGQKESVMTDYILKILGLDICADTMVGDDLIRGISGGQRRRVTTGEMLVGPVKAFFMDNISTGLDSSTTFQIVNAIRQSIHILKNTSVISLLQPAPETYDLFDDIILISEGHIVYQGPREHVLEFFESMGFKCPENKAPADYLLEVTSKKDQKQYWACRENRYSYISNKDFADSFRSFHIGMRLHEELASPFDKSMSHPTSLARHKYGISKKELLKACLSRQVLLMKRTSSVYILKMAQTAIVSIIAATSFPLSRTHHDTEADAQVSLAALYYGITTMIYGEFFELPLTVTKLPVFYKQRDLFFYPAWAYSVPTWLLRIPTSILGALLWVLFSYYTIGSELTAGRIFKQTAIYILTSQMASALLRFIAAISRDMTVASTLGGSALFVIEMLSGFVVPRDDVKKWWIWGYWTSPLMYAQNALAVTEFIGKRWEHIPYGSAEAEGIMILKKRGFFSNLNWYWICIGFLVGYIFLLNGLLTLALTYLNPITTSKAVVPGQNLEGKHSNSTNDIQGDDINESPIKKIQSSQASCGQTEGDAPSHLNKMLTLLPITPLSITFKNITYSIDMPKEVRAQGVSEDRLVLLNDVSGAFRPGVLTALMGVSGAGKSTLLDILAGRKTSGHIEGSIMISGYPKKQETFVRVFGYCEQNDIHSPYLTVNESLLYSSWLRLTPDISTKTRKRFIAEVMELVELTTLRESLVGLTGVGGLSSEQRKRLTIAVELVANPSIIFMDEPTSGLDSRAATIVMRTVRKTVDTGRTVVCTIHQPSTDIFYSFDELLLLTRGGEEIYAGPLGPRSGYLIEYFEQINGIPRIKDGHNPATWMLEITGEANKEAFGVNFVDVYKKSDLFRQNEDLIRELSSPPSNSSDLHFPNKHSQSFLTQCLACLWKGNLSYWRNPLYNGVRFLFSILTAFMLGTLFWGLGSKRTREQDLFSATTVFIVAVFRMGVQNAGAVQPVVSMERTLFYREKAAGMYSALPYAFAQVAIEIPYVLAQSLIYGPLVYVMIGFEWTITKFFQYMFFSFFSFLYFTFFGMMVVSITPNMNFAGVLSSPFYSLWAIFSGIVVPIMRIPIYWRWLASACPVGWTLYGLIGSQYGDIQSKLNSNRTVAEFVSDYFGFRHDFLGGVSMIIIAFNVIFVLIFSLSIMFLNFQNR